MTFVIAEIGVNWEGNFELVEEMIEKAKDSGCNAVKFQAYDEFVVKEHPQRMRLLKSAISKSNIETIDKIARKIGIEWFCTPMYPDAVDLLQPYVSRFKVRESDGRALVQNTLTVLLEKILRTEKEIIVSSQTTPRSSKYFKNSMIKWLYCVPKYPCPLEILEFNNLKDFDGFSNHTPNIIAPLTASILGSKIIEVHITSDKSKDYFDNNVSFDYNELANLVTMIRASERIKR